MDIARKISDSGFCGLLGWGDKGYVAVSKTVGGGSSPLSFIPPPLGAPYSHAFVFSCMFCGLGTLCNCAIQRIRTHIRLSLNIFNTDYSKYPFKIKENILQTNFLFLLLRLPQASRDIGIRFSVHLSVCPSVRPAVRQHLRSL